jgi:hypothetical protein
MYPSSFFLLQGLSHFQIEPKPIQGIIFLFGAALVVLVIVFLNKSKKVKNSAVFKSGTVNKPELGNTVNKNLKKAAHKYELETDEQKFLSRIFDKEGTDPAAVLDSESSIDEGFSKVIQALGREEDSDGDIARLFAIRNKIEYYLVAGEAVKNGSQGKLIVRRYKRVEVKIPVVFYLVVEKEEQKGLKKIKKLSLNNVKCTGIILNISSGGCAIDTRDPCKTGTRLKLEFKIGKTNASALVQILRINKNQDGSILHIRFLKSSVKSLNAINAIAYHYNVI